MIHPTLLARCGLTLIETLVSVCILGLLAALLLPAIQSARESARRTTCQDNLRQIGEAIQSFEAANQALPALYNGTFLPQPRSAVDEFHFHSWRTAILPAIEQSVVYNHLNINLPTTVAANQTAINVGIEIFVCPSSSNPDQNVPDIREWNDGAIPVASIGTAARSDYEVVGGVRVSPQVKVSTNLSNIRFGVWGEPTYDTSKNIVIRYRKARLSDITDGLSNTILVGERAGRPDLYRRGHSVDPYPYRDPAQAGMDHHQAAWAISTHFLWTVFALGQGVNESNAGGFFSFHPGGANVAFADGSVRLLSEATAPEALKGLATRAGAEVVNLP
jgi:prepilin-type processing-associated H-X9-DG protein